MIPSFNVAIGRESLISDDERGSDDRRAANRSDSGRSDNGKSNGDRSDDDRSDSERSDDGSEDTDDSEPIGNIMSSLAGPGTSAYTWEPRAPRSIRFDYEISDVAAWAWDIDRQDGIMKYKRVSASEIN